MLNTTLKKNVVANLGGKVWSGIMQLAFMPLYIKFLGIEAYGLIGFFILLQTLFGLLDLGLSTTLNRELANRTAKGEHKETKDIVRTLEYFYWTLGLLIAAIIIFVAPWISTAWINVEKMPVDQVKFSVVLMGLVTAAQWPYSLYSGGLMGLERQVLLNVTRSIISTVQAVGAVLVIWLISPTISAYFIWQLMILAFQTVFVGYLLHTSLPVSAHPGRFKIQLLNQCWRFAAGMTGISAVSIILTQMDKIILSKLISLEQFGYYTIAFTVGGALQYLVQPILAAVFPRFSRLVTLNNNELTSIYHKSCQVVSLLVFPVSVMFIFFSQPILLLWFKSPEIATNTYKLLSVVAIGSTLNAAVGIPYLLQLSNGWTTLAFYKNVLAIVILVPVLLGLVKYYGAMGGAITWLLLNLGYVLFEIPIMHRRLLKSEMKYWYIRDVGVPALVCVVVCAILSTVFPADISSFVNFLGLVVIYALTFAVCAFNTPFSRNYIKTSVLMA